ncbi:putative cyclin-dependent serine/threonine-protein kinase DDB_G0272797/DDB_G0274007 [Tetranychus urticae]|uniref:putative cyclin-dependent serine/threonine-protein kinase DDB_G0272797/DDB_G0274007 n=1 Tax=Tetranychus urticae TaxID=32264 RepID=UPI00077BDB01|nr:putative cyclin-dependent serine/threonine-protein kinase DDB_G0272797/DDB_G0274007 [Tetranychus urticae]
MGEDLTEVDVRQRKSGKNKNLGDDGYSSPGENVHGASKRRRRGRNDKIDGNVNTPEKEVTSEAIDLKGKIGKKREVNVDDDLGEIVSDGESIDDGVESYVSSKIGEDNDDDRDRDDIGLESEDKSYEDKYQEYQQTSEFQDHSQWSHDYSESDRMGGEIIAEVSDSVGDSQSESNEEAEYQMNQNQDYSHNEPEIDQQPSEEWSWSIQEQLDNSAAHPSNEETNPNPETQSNPVEEQSNPSFDQQAWQYQEQQNEPDQQQQTHEQFHEQIQEQAQEQYEPRPDDQQAQSIADAPEQYDNPPMGNYEPYTETGSYFECPAGSHWDGLACVDSDSYGQIDNTNDYVAQPDSTTESIIYPEQQ